MGVFETTKSIAEVLHKIGKIEEYEQILGLQSQLLDMQNKISELSLENKELKEKLSMADGLIFKDNAYWKEGESYPFCSNCWDSEKKLIHLIKINKDDTLGQCPNCKNYLS